MADCSWQEVRQARSATAQELAKCEMRHGRRGYIGLSWPKYRKNQSVLPSAGSNDQLEFSHQYSYSSRTESISRPGQKVLLGRIGWLNRLRFGLVKHDHKVHLGYDSEAE